MENILAIGWSIMPGGLCLDGLNRRIFSGRRAFCSKKMDAWIYENAIGNSNSRTSSMLDRTSSI